MGDISVGVDVGGTFTDLVAVVDGELVTAKVPSRRARRRGVAAALAAAGVEAEAVGVLAHGTTVATNALLERRGARTALVTTEGFRDVIEIGRQNRPSLYDLTRDRPPPLVPRELRFTVRERMGPEGVVVAARRRVAAARSRRSPPRTSRRSPSACSSRSCTRSTSGGRRGAARGAAGRARFALVRAAARIPGVRALLDHRRQRVPGAGSRLLGADLGRRSSRRPLVMQSSGGVVDAARRPPGAACVLSGPAAGVVGAAFVAGAAASRTCSPSTWAGRAPTSRPSSVAESQVTAESVVAGVPIRFPMVDVHTIGAGGGSIAWLDDGGALRVGPRSAGAVPGPACYGLGGEAATVTDANLVLGYLPTAPSSAARYGSTEPGREAGACGRALHVPGWLGAERHGLGRDGSRRRSRSGRRGRDGAGAPRGQRRARHRSARAGAGRLRRRRAAARLRAGRGARRSSASSFRSAAGVLERPGPRRLGRRRDSSRPPRATRRPVRGDGGSRGAGPAGACDAAAGRRALPGPVARTDRRVPRSWEPTWPKSTSGATAFGPTPSPRSSRAAGRDPAGVTSLSSRARRHAVEPSRASRRRVARPSRPRARLGRRRPAIVELPGSTCLVRAGWSGEPDDAGTLVLERCDARPGHALGDERRPRRDRRGDGHGPRPERVLARTSRSGATARPRSSTRAAGWSPRPSTSPSTSARCPSRSPP